MGNANFMALHCYFSEIYFKIPSFRQVKPEETLVSTPQKLSSFINILSHHIHLFTRLVHLPTRGFATRAFIKTRVSILSFAVCLWIFQRRMIFLKMFYIE